MKTYFIEKNGKILFPQKMVNKRGFYESELRELQKMNEYKDCKSYCIDEEIIKYKLCNLESIDDEVKNFGCFIKAYNDNNLKGFSLPRQSTNNDGYRSDLEQLLFDYVKSLDCPAFAYEPGLLEEVRNEIGDILKALDYLINGEKQAADNIIKEILQGFLNNPFLVSELDNSYSFRCIAPYPEFWNEKCNEEYSKMMREDLTFFRVRILKEEGAITNKEDMLHLPYSLSSRAKSMRFSEAHQPGLYLGTTTYVCCRECDWQNNEDMYASVFIPNSQGRKFKILNLTITQALINGIFDRNLCNDRTYDVRHKLQVAMLKMFPLVIATSFSVKQDEEIKYHYLLSQALMRVVDTCGIDGIAYLSMKGVNEFQYPQGVNLAIPANDISEEKEFSSKCDGFSVLAPVLYENQVGNVEKSYINKIFEKHELDEIESFTSKVNIDGEMQFYGDTNYGKFDDYLVSRFHNGHVIK